MNRCKTCDALLAHDQRYCVVCGERRGPLPDPVAALIAGIREPGAGHNAPAGIVPAETGADEARPIAGWIPSPRVAALAVMGMLAFGAEIGAVVGASGGAALASTPLVLLRQHTQTPAVVTTTAAAVDTGPVSYGGRSSPSSGRSSPASAASSGGSPSPATSPAATTPVTTTTTSTTPTAPTSPYGLPPIKHVFVIMLSDQGYSQTFGSKDPYMSKTLPEQGKLIQWYYGVAGGELANQIALVSGQGPTQQTDANCSTFANITPARRGNDNQVLGNGCVYPRSTETLAGQLTADHLTWKAYIQGMAGTSPGQPQACRHPSLGAVDPNQAPQTGDPYVTWRNPFVYFHSVIDTSACQKDDVDLTQLNTDLTQETTTPNVSYIVPDPCDDGSDQRCTQGGTSGMAAGADSFLRTLVPEIKQSMAYQDGGLIAITFDQAPQAGTYADPLVLRDAQVPQPPQRSRRDAAHANHTHDDGGAEHHDDLDHTAAGLHDDAHHIGADDHHDLRRDHADDVDDDHDPHDQLVDHNIVDDHDASPVNLGTGQGETRPTGGGGQVGLLLISPWVKPGTTDLIDYYNHFSLLDSIEDIFDLKHLGYANQSRLAPLDAGTFDGKGPPGG